MNLTRKYKLYKLGIPTDFELVTFFEMVESKFFNLQIFETEMQKQWKFFMDSDGFNILQYNTNILYVRFNKGSLEEMNPMLLNNIEINKLHFIENMLAEKYGLVVKNVIHKSENWDWKNIELKFKKENA